MAEDLPPALEGERLRIDGPVGGLSIYVAGQGPPLLLIHSINAAASAAEVRPLHDFFRASRRVYSLDLPGFGASQRRDFPYSPRTMTDAVFACIRAIRSESGNIPVDAAAMSLSCEYLARAASEEPGFFRSVSLVSPTGFKSGTVLRGPEGTTRGKPWLYGLLRGPGWGRGLYRLLTRPAVIRYFLRRTWGADDIDEQLWRYDVLTARQPNAEFAPLRFLSANLFSADIHTVYEALSVPVWMSHGVRGDFTDFGFRSLICKRTNWRFTVFPTGALPYFELPQEFCLQYANFMAGS